MKLTEKEIDTLHKIAANKSDEDDMTHAGFSLSAASSACSSSGRRGGAGMAEGVGGSDVLDPAGLEDISLGEMVVWSAMNLWGVWLLTCVLTMWTLRDYLPIRESLQQCKFPELFVCVHPFVVKV